MKRRSGSPPIAPPIRSGFLAANGGPAAARNRGVEEARGAYMLFLGDDTVPEKGLLAVHARAHREAAPASVAVLGYTTWPRDRAVTPFLHHINEYGLQFGYGLIEDPESVPFNFFYTSNISSRAREVARGGPLRHELSARGMGRHRDVLSADPEGACKIVYRPEAVARHHHEITFASFRRRQEKSGESRRRSSSTSIPSWAISSACRRRCRFREGPEPLRGTAAAHSGRLWRERWELPGARRAIDTVLRQDYLRGLRRGLEEAGNGGAASAPVRGAVPLQETHLTLPEVNAPAVGRKPRCVSL